MHAAKQEALETIGKLPEDVDMEEIMYRLYVLDKIRKGQEAVEQGHTLLSLPDLIQHKKYHAHFPGFGYLRHQRLFCGRRIDQRTRS